VFDVAEPGQAARPFAGRIPFQRPAAVSFLLATIHLCGEATPLGRGTIVTEALSWMHPPVERVVETPRRVAELRCSFCRAELGDNLELTIASKTGQSRSTGSFCSAHCRYCVLALAALHPSPLAPDEFVSRRGVLTDRLLDLWRDGRGPDPELVLQAAERASCGLPSADSVVPTAEPSKVAFLRPLYG
jgi:hypothetical protein